MAFPRIYLLAFLCLSHHTWAQTAKGVCDPMDDALFKDTLPRLVFMVREVTTEGLRDAAMYPKDWYRGQIRVVGDYAAGDYEISIANNHFSFLSPMDYFQVVKEDNKAYLQLKTGIDRDGPTDRVDDDTSIITFTLTCIPKASLNLPQVVYDAQVYVDDVNDNDPSFTNIDTRMDLPVSEATPVGSLLTTIEAVDLDLNLDRNLTFHLDSHMDKFSIDRNNGKLSLRSPLDYDTMGDMKFYDVIVSVEDGGPGAIRKVSGVVRVHVTDSDDQGPVYEYTQCWRHKERCSWPKYTTPLQLTKDKPIVTQPVPNKGQGPVEIKVHDLDDSRSKINFHIASTIPPGSEDKFRLETTKMMDGVYKTQIIPKETMNVKEGFEIFLRAEEDTPAKRFVISMIYFTGGSDNKGTETSGKGGQSGTSTDKPGSEALGGGDNDEPTKTIVEENEDEYSERELALIVVVAILATLVLCLVIVLVYTCGKTRSKLSKDGHMNGHNYKTNVESYGMRENTQADNGASVRL